MPNNIELRNLESWHDESGGKLDESCYEELADSANTNGWSADEMFKYNETRHKIMSSYSEKTLAKKYTTPLPKAKSKNAIRMASKLAKEIEDKVAAEGRVTPESSDDDELFEQERTRRTHLKQMKQLNQLLNLKNIGNINLSFGNWPAAQAAVPSTKTAATTMTPPPRTTNGNNSTSTTIINTSHYEPPNTSYSNNISNNNHASSSTKSNRSSSQHSNSSTTPATASLSSSPTLNDSNLIMKPVTSSSRNILRTCLT